MRPLRRRRPPTRSKLACASLFLSLARHFFLQRMRDRSISDNHTRSNDAHVARRCNIDPSTHSKPSIVNSNSAVPVLSALLRLLLCMRSEK